MNNKILITGLAIVLILLVGWLILRGDNTTQLPDNRDDGTIEQQVEQLRDAARDGVVTSSSTASEGESTVVIDAVNFTQDGFAVVRADDNGELGDVLGSSEVLTGFNQNVSVSLDRALEGGETVYIVLYTDTDGDGSFDATGDQVIADAATGAIIELTVLSSGNNEGTGDDEGDGEATEPQTYIVTYTDAGFSPSQLTIETGDTVIFRDAAAGQMWVASAMHPTHTVYPGSDIQLCGTAQQGGMFDQCAAGAEFQFTFDQSGSWGYHNHLQASHFGRVIVE